MSAFRRCGCRDEDGKQLGAKCPKLAAVGKHGRWFYRFSAGTEIDRKTGKPRRRQIGGGPFEAKKAALAAEAEARDKVAKGKYVKPDNMTLGEYAVKWLDRRRRSGSGLRATTTRNYERYIRQDIVPSALGQMKLGDIKRSHVVQFDDDLADAGRGATTRRRILTRLSTILATAVRDELIGSNPALGVDKPALGDGP
jgi:integrase-like protein